MLPLCIPQVYKYTSHSQHVVEAMMSATRKWPAVLHDIVDKVGECILGPRMSRCCNTNDRKCGRFLIIFQRGICRKIIAENNRYAEHILRGLNYQASHLLRHGNLIIYSRDGQILFHRGPRLKIFINLWLIKLGNIYIHTHTHTLTHSIINKT
jgi:hypothetical protein